MKRSSMMCVLVVMFFVIISVATTVSFAQDKVITLRYAGQAIAGDPCSTIEEQWGREIEKRTSGKVKVRYYPGATLSSPFQMYDSVIKDVVDIGSHFMGYTQGRFPLMEGLYMTPIEFPDARSAARIANEVYAKFQPKEMDDVRVMYFHSSPPSILLSSRPVKTLADLKGLKVRAMNPGAQIMAEFGAVPVALPITDAYDAVSKGMLNAVTSPYTAMIQFRLDEVMNYAMEYRGSMMVGIAVVAMNKDKWNAIPPDLQKIIKQVNGEWAVKHADMWYKYENDAKEACIKKGVEVTKLSAEENAKWIAKASVITDKYIANMTQKNLPGEEMLKFVSEELQKSN
jgi:TRAP-type C4-dicarboxylate transport system substrate-binding protein